MENRYDQVMKNIEVTDEMRERILKSINGFDFDQDSGKRDAFLNYKKYLAIAACFLILILGPVIGYKILNLPGEPPMLTTPDIATYTSAEELSEAIAFTVKEIRELPFVVESVKYTSYWGELADIEYIGSDNTAVLRMAAGNEDVSGYSGEFTIVKSHVVNGWDVTIKGNDEQYILAVWHNEGFSFALLFREMVSEQEILDTIQSIK